MPVKSTVQKAFDKIIEDRAHVVAFNKSEEDTEFRDASKKVYVIFDLLRESLTTDRQKHLLSEFDSAKNYVESLLMSFAYRQGLEDSQMIHRELSELGISVTKESVK